VIRSWLEAAVKRIYVRGKSRRIFDADEFATTRRILLVVVGLAGDIHWGSSGGRSDAKQVCSSSLGHWGLKK
jgi:ABC-type transporter lipoprotein component MlaA